MRFPWQGGGQQVGGRSAVVDIYNTLNGSWLKPSHLNGSRSNLAGVSGHTSHAVLFG